MRKRTERERKCPDENWARTKTISRLLQNKKASDKGGFCCGCVVSLLIFVSDARDSRQRFGATEQFLCRSD